MNESIKFIVDRIFWAGVSIDEVVKAYKLTLKQKTDYEKELQDIRDNLPKDQAFYFADYGIEIRAYSEQEARIELNNRINLGLQPLPYEVPADEAEVTTGGGQEYDIRADVNAEPTE